MKSTLSTPLRVSSLVDTIVERLEGAIISGELPPGERFSEQGLAKIMGVSRNPLREAIRRLEGRKLIERIPNIGVRVAALSPRDLYDLLVVREALEGMACRLAAERMEDAEVEALEVMLARHRSQEGIRKGRGYYQEAKDFDFHFRIIRASRNERLVAMLCGDLYDLLRVYRYKSSTMKGRAGQALEEHERIVAALKARDPAAAEASMREHLRNARCHLFKHMDRSASEFSELDRPVLTRPDDGAA
ncbi:GntR family transcriptional regulator [Propylenella binzhouense]|uniref:GntR family transcriptional regulator n=1 Tax=Propylenella binzhouense TaxID=2555902 RepID=A0A964WRX1_9HYPH|nr:GntR family transcriptional regulator [Propylenella binzhouense]MYZ46251.1 GntR family transcriptional regulator [Propylenella binzhouense]